MIDQKVLERPVGGPEVMREQLRHLVEAATLPTVTIQVLPTERGGAVSCAGTFVVLSFPDPEDREILYLEHIAGSDHIEDEEDVRKAILMFDRLRSESLSPADSVALIERMAGEL